MNNFKIGINSKIDCNRAEIDDSVVIGDNVKIDCEFIKLSKFSVIGDNITITCRNFEADEWLYMCDGVEIGRGGCTSPNSNVKIGKHVGIFENTIINPSESVEIGDDVGIGSEVMIWTHGAWLDVLQGFPSDFGPVKIGNNVWLPARNIVLPNVTIGDNSVIGIGSIINKDIPAGSLAAGTPCKVIKENYYPRPLDKEQQKKLIWRIIEDWYKLHKIKDIKDVKTKYEDGKIILVQQNYETIYYLGERKIEGYTNDVSEDLRDYLRRRGIKIYTDRLFKSI
jgi:acetyltransferase-like isoleucine patch superfamily enzyme